MTSACGRDESRKGVLGIIAGILVARHPKTTEGLFDTRGQPTDSVHGHCSGSTGREDIAEESTRKINERRLNGGQEMNPLLLARAAWKGIRDCKALCRDS
jgi:hypothetical protein